MNERGKLILVFDLRCFLPSVWILVLRPVESCWWCNASTQTTLSVTLFLITFHSYVQKCKNHTQEKDLSDNKDQFLFIALFFGEPPV